MLIAAVARIQLPRRDRAALNNGISFHSKTAKETVYDKRREVAHAIARLTRRASKDLAVATELAALLRAERRLERGGIRLECRINGSKEIARRLKIDRAQPALVLTTDNAVVIVGAFLRALERRLNVPAAPHAAFLLSEQLGSVRGQRAFALLALASLCGSIEAAATLLGIQAGAAARLTASARSAGVGAIDLTDGAARSPLALPAISVEGTDRFERRLLRTWRRTHPATLSATQNFSLSSAA